MKKLLILSTLLLSLTLGSCSTSPSNNNSKSSSNSGDETMEDVYVGYPNNPEGYNLPKHASYDVHFETDANSNGSHDVHTFYDYHVIIQDDQIYGHYRPSDDKVHYDIYMKGRYIAGKDDYSYLHSWMYDAYIRELNDDGIKMWGSNYRYLLTGDIQIALAYVGPKFFFDFSNISERISSKTGNSRIIEGEECEEYTLTYWGGHYFYYSKEEQIIKGFRLGGDIDYQFYYIVNYKTDDADEIVDELKPGSDILIA